jgi:ABC-type multidrug transport system ATPase subunit
MDRPALAFTSTSKRFGDVEALRDVTFEVPRGDLFGFLGQNGAGKTTAIRVLARLLKPTAGQAELLGHDVWSTPPERLFSKTGFLIEAPTFMPHQDGFTNLMAHARLLGLRTQDGAAAECDRQHERFGLTAAARRKVGGYSLGMRQRLCLAQAFLGSPDLLVLDEPVNGLDPGGIADVRELLRDEQRRGATVFLSSHLLTEVEALCNRVAVIDRGRVVACGTVEELVHGGGGARLRTGDDVQAKASLARAGFTLTEDDAVGFGIDGGDADVARALASLHRDSIDVFEASRTRRSLEDVYRDLTGH